MTRVWVETLQYEAPHLGDLHFKFNGFETISIVLTFIAMTLIHGREPMYTLCYTRLRIFTPKSNKLTALSIWIKSSLLFRTTQMQNEKWNNMHALHEIACTIYIDKAALTISYVHRIAPAQIVIAMSMCFLPLRIEWS